MIKVISHLFLFREGLKSKDKRGHYQQAHWRQGDLDGACGIYCLIMDLVLIKSIDAKVFDVDYEVENYRNSIGRITRKFLENQGFKRDGYTTDYLEQDLHQAYNKEIETELVSRNGKIGIMKNIPLYAKETIDQDLPLIISVLFKGGGGHYLVVVGYEQDKENGPISKLFCLDPGYDSSNFSYWNATIVLEPEDDKDASVQCKSLYLPNEIYVRINDALKIWRKERRK